LSRVGIQWEVEAVQAARGTKSYAATSKLRTAALRGSRRAVKPLARGARLVDPKSLVINHRFQLI
jgi:hypothetical protein